MSNLVIVESPAKAHTIKGYLGNTYKIIASKGHIRDLPKSTLGIDVDNGFEAHYINIRGKGDLIKELKAEAKKADKVFLATDPDREGEAISWHLATALSIPEEKIKRVTFNEITKTAVKDAIKHPRNIDMNLVNAQQTRRIMDRVVGYKLSPVLWQKIKNGLSAGRVQSVATRIIVEREEEIKAFIPSEYWTIDANLLSGDNKSFVVHYYGTKGKKVTISNEADAQKIIDEVKKSGLKVADIKTAMKKRLPAPPFTTSTLQQEAARKLGFQSQKTMRIAQELYEGVNLGTANGGIQGLITYIRTDSLRISKEAQASALKVIEDNYGKNYVPSTPRFYKSKGNIQDAHEAIRPSNMELAPLKIRKMLSADQYRLYKLIWERFIASQMNSADVETVNIVLEGQKSEFRAVGSTIKFPGFLAIYEESTDDIEVSKDITLPELKIDEFFGDVNLVSEQHFTEHPPRYTEASLIKFLEEKGIGRPSTFSPIITIILARGYAARDGKALVPTQLGELTTKLMKDAFSDIVDYEFTADMESKLDDIADGKDTLQNVMNEFYSDFVKELSKAENSISNEDYKIPVEETDIVCELCGSKMVVRKSRFGKFAACPNYPKCRNTKSLEPTEETAKRVEKPKKELVLAPFKCEACGGDVVVRNGAYGEFYACVNYPKCKFTKPKNTELGVKCPDCEDGQILIRHGKKSTYYCCENYPKCKFSTWDMPTNEKCPKCGKMLFTKKNKHLVFCKEENCGYSKIGNKN